MNDDQQRDNRPKTFAEYMDGETRNVPAAPLYFAAPGLCIYGTAQQVTAMWAAVSEAQGQFPAHIEKDRKVTIRPKDKSKPPYSYRYAQLSTIKEATMSPLAEHGLAVLQPFSQLGGMPLCCRTLLTHREGAFMVSVVQREADHELKIMGGDTTYLQRYAYRSLFGLATDDDTDESDPEGGEVEAEDVIRLPNMKWLGEHAGKDITKCPDDALIRFADWQKGKLDPDNQYYEANKRTLAGIDALLVKREKAAAAAHDAAKSAEVAEGDPWGLAGDEPAAAQGQPVDPKLLTAIGDAARELGLNSRKALSEYCRTKLAARDYTAAVADPETAKSLLTYLHQDISEKEAGRG